LNEKVLVAVASGSEDLIPTLIDRMRDLAPGLPLYVVSEFKVEGATWIPFHLGRTLDQNLALCRSVLAGKQIRFAGLILQPRMPYWRMRFMALQLGGWNTVFFNENLNHFLLRPHSAGTIARHLLWRAGNLVRWELRPGGSTYTFFWRLAHPKAFLRPVLAAAARIAGSIAASRRSDSLAKPLAPANGLPRGITVVIPSRDGRELLERLLPGLTRELAGFDHEIIVADNGSSDRTAQWLAETYPAVRVIAHPTPLSFSRAVNQGVAAARFSHTMMLNNDMVLEPGFFPPLLEPFDSVPNLFCSTAQILFSEGVRREETGKAVMPRKRGPEDFPVSCDLPLDGEDSTYVLYGSGGCSLFDTAKLRAIGALREIYEPAYVEDLDLGYRGWQQGWPTVFAANARLVHRHRATTSRYYTQADLDRVLELNYLRFVAGSVASPGTFSTLWKRAIARLDHRAARMEPDPAAIAALKQAWRLALFATPAPSPADEAGFLALTSGDVSVFPGRKLSAKPRVVVVSPYVPFPLAHGGAVRMYNLMRRAATDFDQILVCFVDQPTSAPREILDICTEAVLIVREGDHLRPLTHRPDAVEEFDVPSFRAALRQTIAKWRPGIVQLEFTQLALYAKDCAPARTILVEHDVTLDLYRQMLERGEDWETRQQYERWVRFETNAWNEVDAVVTMSEKDRAALNRDNAVTLANGVDLERFTPGDMEPEPGRVLFIGSFAHLPNLFALDFFLRSIWPRIRESVDATFHIIAGSRPGYFLERYAGKVAPPLDGPGIELEGFVPDPRIAYRRASVVVAPLLASAGTNIKIMEAMAMGKAIVSTPGGINGLDDLQHERDLLVAADAEAFAAAVVALLQDLARRRAIERQARSTVEAAYGWDAIAIRQRDLYRKLLGSA
jgi:glycosyltransferase involved in cell wall biosynthesis/GT2 family glycosyltransferase